MKTSPVRARWVWAYLSSEGESGTPCTAPLRAVQNPLPQATLGPAVTQPHRVFMCLGSSCTFLPAPPPLSSPAVAVPVFGSDIRHDVLVEELQDQRDAVGKHQMLGHVLKLRKRSEMGQR